jgi:hypothetical protein
VVLVESVLVTCIYMYPRHNIHSSIGLIFGISLPLPEVMELDAMTPSSRPLPGSLRPDDNIFFQPTSQRTQRLPDWLNHFNRKDLQVFFRCFVSVWVYTLFVVINPTLKALGTATFFGAILIFIAPPSGVIFIGLMTAVTLFLGISLAWAWGTIAMKAALATRPAGDLQRKYQLLQSSGATDLQEMVLNGFFLDSRVTITYFCMMIPFIYLVVGWIGSYIHTRGPR